MSSGWLPQGIIDFVPYSFSPDTRKSINTTVNANFEEISSSVLSHFVEELEDAASFYIAMEGIEERVKPSIAKRNLNSILNTVMKLEEKLKSMDDVSRALFIKGSDGSYTDIDMFLGRFYSGLRAAIEETDNFPTSGRQLEYAKLELGKTIALAIQNHLSCNITSRKETLFTQCITLVLSDITGKLCEDPHTLAEKIIKSMQNENVQKNL